ncbi:MAG TPA: hypothetical protein VK659_28960 [Asanoa sp.]|nr:hypothetical protein [Asanoa sp.]
MSGTAALPTRAPETGKWAAVRALAPWCVPAAALAVAVLVLRAVPIDRVGSLGLVDVLPAAFYVAVAGLTVSFVGELLLGPHPRPAVLMLHLLVLVVLLHGAASIAEPLPRFVPAWLHVGFADYIARTGGTLPELDARFSWPGFFALAAMATRAAGLSDAIPLLAWTPVALNLLFVAVVYRLARAFAVERRGAWLTAWLFVPANWVGQDYFAPQGVNYLFYLVVLATLVVWFRPSRLDRVRRRAQADATVHIVRPRAWRRLGLPQSPLLYESEPAVAAGPARAGLMVLVLVVFAASTASHQLTPVAILLAVAALVACRRFPIGALPVALVVIMAGYVSYLTVAYWSGHLDDMFGTFGQIGRTVQSGVGDRVQGDRGHLLVLQVRQVFAVAVWAAAAVGVWWRLRRRRGDLALFVLAGAPFLLLFVQSYGGEVLLRVYTFALPFMLVLAVGLILPPGWTSRPVARAVVAGLLSLAMTGAFLLARYGNESFERVRPADLTAVEWLYGNATPGVTFVALTSNLPWRFRDVEQYRYTPLGEDLGPDSLPAIEAAMRANPRGAYLILTEGQYALAEGFLGKPPGWGTDIERQVASSGRFRLVYDRDGAKIFVLDPSRR